MMLLQRCGWGVLLVVLTSAWAGAQTTVSVKLAWDRTTDPTVTGFQLYWGPTPGTYPSSVVIANKDATTWTLDLPPGTYTFALKAFNADGVFSGYSNAVTTVLPLPEGPGRLPAVRVPVVPP